MPCVEITRQLPGVCSLLYLYMGSGKSVFCFLYCTLILNMKNLNFFNMYSWCSICLEFVFVWDLGQASFYSFHLCLANCLLVTLSFLHWIASVPLSIIFCAHLHGAISILFLLPLMSVFIHLPTPHSWILWCYV